MDSDIRAIRKNMRQVKMIWISKSPGFKKGYFGIDFLGSETLWTNIKQAVIGRNVQRAIPI